MRLLRRVVSAVGSHEGALPLQLGHALGGGDGGLLGP